MISGDDSIIDAKLDAENYSIPLNLTTVGESSRLLNSGEGKEWSVDVKSMVQNYPITLNNHMHGVYTKDFEANSNLVDFFDVISTNVDRNGISYISTVESKDPEDMIYATQWHPEKNTFEYGAQAKVDGDFMQEDIDHGEVGRRVSFEMGNFFVKQIGNEGRYDGTRMLALEESEGRVEGDTSFEERLVFKI